MMKKTYYGYYEANNSTHNRDPYIDTNLQRLCKTMRSICKGNVFRNNSGWWAIYDDADYYERELAVKRGKVSR